MKQRNTLLRTARQTKVKGSALSTLDAWDEQLVRFGSEIVAARLDLIEQLKPFLVDAYQAIAITNNEPQIRVKSSLSADSANSSYGNSDEELELEYLEPVDGKALDRDQIAEMYRAKIATVRDKELERGITMVGPHRDDLVLLLGTLPAKGYASHGESWSFALALRLASIDLLKKETQSGDPILILDDVFAELDSGRRQRLASLVANNEQVLITAAVAEDVPDELIAKVFHVKLGTVTHD